MVTWLQSACDRLAAVASVRVELPWQPDAEVEPMDPVIMDSLLAAIGRACPNLHCLRMDGI